MKLSSYTSGSLFNLSVLLRRIGLLLRSRVFWLATLAGNLWVLGGATLFWLVEAPENKAISGFLDCYMWAISVVTTVGGPLHPVSFPGKLVSILMMTTGAVFLWSYMAIFVSALVDPDLESIQKELLELQQEIERKQKS